MLCSSYQYSWGEHILKLLIAIKSEIITELLVASLSMHDIHTCDTGPDTLAMLEKHRPDALILDLALPVIDGLTVLRKTSFLPDSILALTNLATPTVLRASTDVGVQDMILLPCSIRYIVKRLNALIDKAPLAES